MPVAYYLNFIFVTCRVVINKELGVPVSTVQQSELGAL